MNKLMLAVAGFFLLSACATGTTDLTLGLADTELKPGVLSESEATQVTLTVTDGREQTDRIGDKRNGYGAVMGAVGTTEPVTDIIASAIDDTFAANGHSVVESGGALDIAAVVERFWFDYKTGLVTVEFFGDIQVAISAKDPSTGDVVFEDTYKGYYSDKTGGGLSKTWTRIMDTTLAEFSRELSLSTDLAEAFEDAELPAASTASADASEDVLEPVS